MFNRFKKGLWIFFVYLVVYFFFLTIPEKFTGFPWYVEVIHLIAWVGVYIWTERCPAAVLSSCVHSRSFRPWTYSYGKRSGIVFLLTLGGISKLVYLLVI